MRGLYDGCEPEQQAQSMKQGIVREASSPASRHRGSPPYSEQPRHGSTPASARRGHTPRSLVSLDAAMRPRASGTPISQRWPTPPSTTSRRNSSRPFSSRGQQSLVRPTGAFPNLRLPRVNAAQTGVSLQPKDYNSPSFRPAGEDYRPPHATAIPKLAGGLAPVGGRPPGATCEICERAGRFASASYGAKDENAGRFCGVCVSTALATSGLNFVRVDSCSTCGCFLAEVPTNRPPAPTSRPKFCHSCAVERCAVAHSTVDVDSYSKSRLHTKYE
jgi:hypothetical protein